MRKVLKRALSLVCAAMVLSLLSNVPLSSAAPEYPPSIQSPVAGEPLFAPVPAERNVDVVVVPKAVSDSVPQVSGRQPTPITPSATRSLPENSATPVRLTRGLLLGGVKQSDISDTPLASVSSKRDRVEVQLVSDVPTRLRLTNLPARSGVSIQIVTNGRAVTVGRAQATSKGTLTLPPLTLTSPGSTREIRIVSGKETLKYFLRSID